MSEGEWLWENSILNKVIQSQEDKPLPVDVLTHVSYETVSCEGVWGVGGVIAMCKLRWHTDNEWERTSSFNEGNIKKKSMPVYDHCFPEYSI